LSAATHGNLQIGERPKRSGKSVAKMARKPRFLPAEKVKPSSAPAHFGKGRLQGGFPIGIPLKQLLQRPAMKYAG
jgi:hypothetical protein